MKAFFQRVLASLAKIGGPFFKRLFILLRSGVADLLDQLTPIAVEVVLSLADSKLTGEEKRKEAVRRIQAAAIGAGIAAAASTINLAVETAVASLKAEGELE